MPSTVAALLKARTGAAHLQVEDDLGLREGQVDAERLAAIVARFAGFWPVLESGVDEWAARQPVAAGALAWPRRRRSPVIRQDLLAFGLSPADIAALPAVAPVFAAPLTDADVLGWLYVAEGSTLGGAVIDRLLRRPGASPQLPAVSTFTPYSEGPGPMWRAYLQFLSDWVGDDAVRTDAVVAAAERCFSALAGWLAPLRAGEAAA